MHQASVIIPTHNRPHYLREALQSVVDQEGVELDVIVVGDGATEETAQVAAGFPGVRYVRQSQAGPNAARNHALTMARFDYVALLDDDDLWLPGKMRAQLSVLHSQPDAAYLFSDFHILRAGQPLQPKGLSTWGIPAEDLDALHSDALATEPRCYRAHLYHALLEHPYVLPTAAVFRKSFLTPEIRFVEADAICGDWEFFARLSKNHAAIYMPVETACNRSHEEAGRLTRTPDVIQLQRRLDMIARTWAADADFMAVPDNRRRVEDIQFRYLTALAKQQLRDGSAEDIRQTLDRARTLNPNFPTSLRALRIASALPGGIGLLRGIDRTLRRTRALMGR